MDAGAPGTLGALSLETPKDLALRCLEMPWLPDPRHSLCQLPCAPDDMKPGSLAAKGGEWPQVRLGSGPGPAPLSPYLEQASESHTASSSAALHGSMTMRLISWVAKD